MLTVCTQLQAVASLKPIKPESSGKHTAMNMGMMLQQLTTNADAPPTCAILQSAGSEARARWQNDLDDYDYRVWQYRQTHPWYVPTLSKWVSPGVWKAISEELLNLTNKLMTAPPTMWRQNRSCGKKAGTPPQKGSAARCSMRMHSKS